MDKKSQLKDRSGYKTYLLQIAVLIAGFALLSCQGPDKSLPRVFVFTDINIDSGDPDDRQSLIHLCWYADELRIEGIVPDRWNARGLEACNLVMDAYENDYRNYSLHASGYPEPGALRNLMAGDAEDAMRLFSMAAADTSSPLYVLVWGNMELFQTLLSQKPELAKNIRLITIGTGLMLEEDIQHMPAAWEKSLPCEQLNWNGFGRNSIYHNDLFKKMWWVEMNWTYAGMFSGKEPRQMFGHLSEYGALGKHMKEVVKNEPWAQYFRVGDTPSVLYLLDPAHDRDDPTKSSWAGRFMKPFPEERPNYYTDCNGTVDWNYENPCLTWQKHTKVRDYAVSTLEERRDEMYTELLDKLNRIYGKE